MAGKGGVREVSLLSDLLALQALCMSNKGECFDSAGQQIAPACQRGGLAANEEVQRRPACIMRQHPTVSHI